ncbi:aromatic amino acid DMT transporter YddG [Psychromonas sp. PT13]|uniref:aromatic amino acid DMT transporter YddG n=1 Tax=Psychromonas sp. PT13 TaxID=3439547 RepID=UPI003EBBBCD8
MFIKHKFTLYGVMAILLWSCVIALLRNNAELLGPIGGAAMVYSLSSVMLIAVLGFPKLRDFSIKYLIIGGGLFASYEVLFSLALGFANDRVQTIEMGVINYLWPSFTVLFAILAKKHFDKKAAATQKPTSWLVYPSIGLAFFGVAWSILGDQGFSIASLSENISSNPVAYSFAFSGAIIWGFYCSVTKYLSDGKNAITLFFIFTAIALWIEYAISDEPVISFSTQSVLSLFITSAVMASGYALWNVAIIGGNMMFLATLSYFTPIFSSFTSTIILGVALGQTFWQGVIFVTIGSLICWWVTREKSETLIDSAHTANET